MAIFQATGRSRGMTNCRSSTLYYVSLSHFYLCPKIAARRLLAVCLSLDYQGIWSDE